MYLAHRWRLTSTDSSDEIIREFLRPAVRAVPRAIAARWSRCDIALVAGLGPPPIASRWTLTNDRLEIAVATAEVEPHDVALELLICIGQSLWETLSPSMHEAWRGLLCTELEERITGEIDQQALDAKRALLKSRSVARGRRRWEEYARSSFASSVAEYVHCLWHDVTVRTGPDHLPARCLRRRLVFLAAWFPPDRGQRLFAAARSAKNVPKRRRRAPRDRDGSSG